MTDALKKEKAETLLACLRKRRLVVATAESCTGGLVAAAITDIPGASDVFDRGFVAYSNESKRALLGVEAETIATHGAVSAQTARAMALGALARSVADITIAVTGVAGPGGGTEAKPVGVVYFACARRGDSEPVLVERRFGPLTREAIRAATVLQALDLMIAAACADHADRP